MRAGVYVRGGGGALFVFYANFPRGSSRDWLCGNLDGFRCVRVEMLDLRERVVQACDAAAAAEVMEVESIAFLGEHNERERGVVEVGWWRWGERSAEGHG